MAILDVKQVNSLNNIYSFFQACMVEIFKAKCQGDEVVLMQHAVYGRMQIGRCIASDLGHLECKSGKCYIY